MIKAAKQLEFNLGIIGGGQLARMLALACHEMGVCPHILSEKSSDPAAQVVANWHQGNVQDPKALKRFLESCDRITFESEFIDLPISPRFAFLKKSIPKFFPHIDLMSEVQDRRFQKNLLNHFKIPTSPFCIVETRDTLLSAVQKIQLPAVLKKCRGGYDGYGTFVLKSKKDLENFLTLEWPGPCILEKWIPFRRELALLIARSSNGSFADFPLIQSHQKDHRCDWIVGPVEDARTISLRKKIKSMMSKKNYIGILAVEIFDSEKGLFVNELAPRVHNTGHYSQDALTESQFHSHVRAGLGQDLDSPNLRSTSFAMVNLIGDSNREFVFPKALGGRLHWYGKQENRKGRKMGHINYVGKSQKELLKQALRDRKGIQA